MLQRMVIVILTMLLAGCGSASSGVDEGYGGVDPNIEEVLAVPFTSDMSYMVRNPNRGWRVVGRDFVATDNPGIIIQVRLDSKAEGDQAFEEALLSVTADEIEIKEQDGIIYAEGTNVIDVMTIYRDDPDFIISIRLIQTYGDDIAAQYIEEWRQIALEGELVIFD